jgi:hypothetical protein
MTRIDAIPVSCPHCSNQIMGHFKQGRDFVQFVTQDGWRIPRQASKYCPECGTLFHYSRPRKSWDQLVREYVAEQAHETIKGYTPNGTH